VSHCYNYTSNEKASFYDTSTSACTGSGAVMHPDSFVDFGAI